MTIAGWFWVTADNDGDFGANAAITFAINKHFVVSLSYNYDAGRNLLDTLPAKLFGAYRDFSHNITSLSVQYKL